MLTLAQDYLVLINRFIRFTYHIIPLATLCVQTFASSSTDHDSLPNVVKKLKNTFSCLTWLGSYSVHVEWIVS